MAGLKDGRVKQAYHSPVSQYGGSKPEVVNKNSENLDAWSPVLR